MLKIIDAHQHFWTLSRDDYGWLTPDLKKLYRDYMPQHLAATLMQHHVVGTVLVQAAPTLAETHYLLSLAENIPFIKGVVGWVDLTADDAVETITTLARNPYFKGVRPMLQDIDDPNWINTAPRKSAIQALIDHNITFDVLMKAQHQQAINTFIGNWPKLKCVIDHAAKPDMHHADITLWQDDMNALAQYDNTYVKISGFESANQLPNYEQLIPYFQHLLASFTAKRMIWVAYWPVVNIHGDYDTWLALCEQAFAECTEEARTTIFFTNACEAYHLDGEV